ncbi:MAG: hypothetical protein IKH11_04295 [Bacteroidales bacterium]|nr:hypothetical protein [Bacteroidales bacterium]
MGPYAKDETYSASKGVEIRNCTNEANIKFNCYMVASGGPKMCFGGVVGASTANMKNCHNNKALTINTQTKYIYSGGVVGFIEADMDNCSNKGIITVDGCADESTINYTQAYIGGVFGTVTKGSTLSNLKNSGSVTVSNVVSTDSALSYVGGVGSYYIGSFKLENSSNTATVNSNADTPVCLGGVMGAFNGTMTNCKNSGKVMYSSTYISPYEKDGGDKKPEIGGLVGYANADFIGCSNTGTVTSVADDGYLSGFVAGFGNASKTWANCTVNCSVESSATNASVLGRFRNIASNQTITLGAEDQPFTIEGPTAELPKFGQDCGTGNQVVMFE